MSDRIEVSQKTLLSALDSVVSETRFQEFLILGSAALTAVLGDNLPQVLRLTADVDLTPIRPVGSPEEAKAEDLIFNQVTEKFGEKSEFKRANIFYVSCVDRIFLSNGPENWEERCIDIELPSGNKLKALDPHDLACFKLAAARPKDVKWLIEAIASDAINLPMLSRRLETCPAHLLKAKEGIIKTAWAEVGEDLKGRGVVCWKDIFPESGHNKGMGRGI